MKSRYNDGTPDVVEVSSDLHTLEVDVVLLPGETPDQAAAVIAKDMNVTWEQVESGNCHPGIKFSGDPATIRRLQSRYRRLGEDKRHFKGKPPVDKGQKRV